jgi:hypothetical protein
MKKLVYKKWAVLDGLMDVIASSKDFVQQSKMLPVEMNDCGVKLAEWSTASNSLDCLAQPRGPLFKSR